MTSRHQRSEHRRGHTRWLMVIPLTLLTLVVIGVVALEAAAPQADQLIDPVEDLPPVAVRDAARTCTRSDEATTAEIREEHQSAEGRITSDQIYACPEAFDRLEVVYAGEVVGELLPRRDGAWAQVNDDAYALEVGPLVGHRQLDGFNTGMSVWLPDGLHERVEQVGRPRQRGDVIVVRGTAQRSDPGDGGGLTIRATELEVLAPSTMVEDPFHVPQAITAGILALLAVAASVWARWPR